MPTLYTALMGRKQRRAARLSVRAATDTILPERHLISAEFARVPTTSRARVIIVGAGFAGLSAAHELNHLGFDVTVLESRPTPGGRVRSFTDVVPDMTMEGGGELIGTNHPMWQSFAKTLRLTLRPIPDETGRAPVYLGGRRIAEPTGRRLAREMDRITDEWNHAARHITDPQQPWLADGAAALDEQTLAEWLKSRDCSELARRAMASMMETDNGVAACHQSWLGNLAMIAGGGFERYWTDTELQRCDGGNQRLAQALAQRLGDKVTFNVRVREVACAERSVSVVLSDGGRHEAEYAVLAVPPTMWRELRISPALPRRLNIQMGRNTKFLLRAAGPFWKSDGLSPEYSSDSSIGLLWDSTSGQTGASRGVVAFSGGRHADECSAWTPLRRPGRYVRTLRRAYSQVTAAYLDSHFMDWPNDPLVRGSYSFPGPGEITQCGPTLHRGLGRLHFAGEHTCYAFVGYMEGALQSGQRVARQIATAEGAI